MSTKNKNEIQLSKFCHIQTGLTLNKSLICNNSNSFRASLIQLGDISSDGLYQESRLEKLDFDETAKKFVVQEGDLVFRGRGASIASAVISKTEIPIVVASPLIIIKPDLLRVDPNYLSWFLTSKSARKFFSTNSQGSVIVGVGKRDLMQMPISLPLIKTQKKIGNLKKLLKKEEDLLLKLSTAKEQFIESILEDLTNKEFS